RLKTPRNTFLTTMNIFWFTPRTATFGDQCRCRVALNKIALTKNETMILAAYGSQVISRREIFMAQEPNP
ncbi:hypothetical protein L2224_22735, partial [Xanthomonas perforans]|nr:hypothetical protein [Xanthomonas perforans]